MRKTLIVSIVALSLLAGCMGSDAELYVQEPATDKTVMVPPALSATSKVIKNLFRNAGWKTFVTGLSIQKTGSGGKYINVNTSVKYPARYSVWAESRVYDLCVPRLNEAIKYDISIVDNITGEEVAAFSGRVCDHKLEKEIGATLAPFL